MTDTTMHFVGRAEQLERIARVLDQARPGLVVVTGEPGSGRSALLRRVPGLAVAGRDEPIVLDREHGPDVLAAALRALPAADGGPRPLLVLDDAHLAGHALIRAMRDAHRYLGAGLVVSYADGAPEGALSALRYEPGAEFVALPPLTPHDVAALLGAQRDGAIHPAAAAAVHAAAEGSPELLADLLRDGALIGAMTPRDGLWRLNRSADLAGHRLTARGTRTLTGALDRAWQTLDFDRSEELSALALSLGSLGGRQAVAVHAFVLLMRGRAAEGLAFLDGATDRGPKPDGGDADRRLSLVRALLLGLGLGRVEEAAGALLRESEGDGDGGIGSGTGTGIGMGSRGDTRYVGRLLAYRAWLLAVAGQAHEAQAALHGLPHGTEADAEAAVFARAAAAAVSLGRNEPMRAVPQLRRALISAQQMHTHHPWLSALLMAYLIDASLLAGRITEATELAADFHAAAQGSGWDAAVALSALIASIAPQRAAGADLRTPVAEPS
jgi:hypothetical protein